MSTQVATKARASLTQFGRLARRLEAIATDLPTLPTHRPEDVRRVPMQTQTAKTYAHVGTCASSMRATSHHMSESHVAIWHRCAH